MEMWENWFLVSQTSLLWDRKEAKFLMATTNCIIYSMKFYLQPLVYVWRAGNYGRPHGDGQFHSTVDPWTTQG